MRDPVITPSGITYDRKDLEEHLMVNIFEIILSINFNELMISVIFLLKVPYSVLFILNAHFCSQFIYGLFIIKSL